MSKHAIVLRDFSGVDLDNFKRLCIVVKQGSKVDVLTQTEEDWWLVGNGEKVGYVPTSCLSAVIEDTAGYGYQLRKPKKKRPTYEYDYDNLEDDEEDHLYANLELEINREDMDDDTSNSTSSSDSEISLALEIDSQIFEMELEEEESELWMRPRKVQFSETLLVRELKEDGTQEEELKSLSDHDEADIEGDGMREEEERDESGGYTDQFEDYEERLDREDGNVLGETKRERYYGYFQDLKFSEGYFKYYFDRCEKDTCELWKYENHEKCYDGERVPNQDESVVPTFISNIFNSDDEQESEKKPRRNIFLDLFTEN